MNWFDPEWFAPRNLEAEWARQDWRTPMRRVATMCAVLLFCASPLTLSTAFYIDTVGLDVFLALLELQLLVGAILLSPDLPPAGRAASPMVVRTALAFRTCLRLEATRTVPASLIGASSSPSPGGRGLG